MVSKSLAVDDLRAAVAASARALADRGLSPGTSSNVSARIGEVVAITSTGLTLSEARPEAITVVDLEGEVLIGELAPTSELELHLTIYRDKPGAGAVVHTHSPYATAFGLVHDELPVIHYEQLLLGGPVRVAPFAVFGTHALAENVRSALQGRKAALMANHGAVVWGIDLAEAKRNALLLEWLSALYLRSLISGEPRTLSAEQQQAVVAHAIRTGYGAAKRSKRSKRTEDAQNDGRGAEPKKP